MLRFQVPQFIEREARVVGPFTFKQFIYLGVPTAAAFFLYFIAPFFVFLFSTVVFLSIGFLFAFVNVGGRSFPTILLNFLHFSVGPKTYIWKKGLPADPAQSASRIEAGQPLAEKPKVKLVKESKIKTLATHVETNK
ncbi:MAG: PrgI family protein [Candidatus Wildermuthbacteria bacterium]|nr:PrgI family protein [Candidatus Wildermuthbacteria bacterium]